MDEITEETTLKQFLKMKLFGRKPKITIAQTPVSTHDDIEPTKRGLTTKRISLLAFLAPPIIISIISIIHLYDFFLITNSASMAFSIAFSFELVSISSLIALTVLDKINSRALWTVFWLVATYQIIGNVHASFVDINDSLFKKFVEMFWMVDTINSRRLIAIVQGAALPIISLSLIKLAVDYMSFEMLFSRSKNGPKLRKIE
jgi:hypothetical protein